MAKFNDAQLTKYQARISQMFQAGDLRFRIPAVFNSFRESTEIMIPSHNEIKNAAKRTTGEVNYFKRTLRALGLSGEAHDHTGAKGDSGVLVPAWTTYDDKFYYSIKQANGSVWTLDDEILSELTNVFTNFAEGLEEAAATYLHVNRSGVNVYDRQGQFNSVNDVFEITVVNSSVLDTGYRIIQIIKSAMEANKWRGGSYVAYCDTIFFDKMQALAANGSGNSINTSFQFSGVEFVKSVELDAKGVDADATYINGYCIVAQKGSLAVLDWIPIQNRQGIVTWVNKYGTLVDPNTGLLLATHSYEARADEVSNVGDRQDVKVETQVFTSLSFNHAPLSVLNETPMMAFALL